MDVRVRGQAFRAKDLGLGGFLEVLRFGVEELGLRVKGLRVLGA